MQSVFSAPNPVLFGTNSSEAVGKKLKEMGCSKVMVVYDQGIKDAGVADKIVGYIKSAGVDVVIYDKVQADPPDWSVNEAGELGIKEKIDGVVGIGGGSSLDTAKGVKMLQTNPPPINQYFGREGVVTRPSVPLIVIPTTAGTGSECTPGGVITDTKAGVKNNIAGVGCTVSLGIVDPALTVGLPPRVTAATGMDALCHCCESLTSNLANSFSTVVGKEGIRLVSKYLVRAVKDGSDMEAREGMMLASTLGGMAMSGALCHSAHDIGKVLGAHFHIAHGNACASTLPQVLQVAATAKPEQVRYIAECFGAKLADNATPEEIGNAAFTVINKLIKDIGLPSLREFGVTKEEILAVVPDGVLAMVEGMIKLFGACTSPVPVTRELITNIVSRAYDEN